MKSVKKEELWGIIDRLWEGELARCPSCNTILKFARDSFIGGWVIIVSCPRCGFNFQWTNKDDEEMRALYKEKRR